MSRTVIQARQVHMDKDLAKHVASMTFRAMAQLQEVVPILKAHCDADEYDQYLKAIGSVVAVAATELLDRIYEAYPEIETEFEAKISKYGKVI